MREAGLATNLSEASEAAADLSKAALSVQCGRTPSVSKHGSLFVRHPLLDLPLNLPRRPSICPQSAPASLNLSSICPRGPPIFPQSAPGVPQSVLNLPPASLNLSSICPRCPSICSVALEVRTRGCGPSDRPCNDSPCPCGRRKPREDRRGASLALPTIKKGSNTVRTRSGMLQKRICRWLQVRNHLFG